jgi:hypothetical protein
MTNINYNDGKWHGWNGGECPVNDKTHGEFVFQDGSICVNQSAGEWEWDDDHLPIIAFRVTKEHKEPREFWICGSFAHDTKEEAEERSENVPCFMSPVIHVREELE